MAEAGNYQHPQGVIPIYQLSIGFASAPAIFQWAMDVVLQGIPNTMSYLDDILVTRDSDQQHLATLSTVLERLQTYGFQVKKSKCEFMGASMEYLGHQIDAEGLHTTAAKLAVIQDTLPPRNEPELHAFLELVNYSSKFIPNFST